MRWKLYLKSRLREAYGNTRCVVESRHTRFRNPVDDLARGVVDCEIAKAKAMGPRLSALCRCQTNAHANAGASHRHTGTGFVAAGGVRATPRLRPVLLQLRLSYASCRV